MNIYLVSQKVNDDWDTYDSFVIACKDEITARNMHPDGRHFNDFIGDDVWFFNHCWCSPDDVSVKLIGTTDLYLEPTIILTSFNAG